MTIAAVDLDRFRERIEAQFGLVFDEGRKEQVEQALLTRSSELGLKIEKYIEELQSNAEEWHAIAELLTVPESYFFRHIDHLQAFREVVLPERMAAHPDDRTLRICCIGCANGEEPYTMSMLIREHLETHNGWQFRIQACDINPEALKRARRGLYTNWALRATPPAYRNRYFTAAANRFRVADEVRQSVHFDHCNVLNLYRPELAQTFDVVFFRNVLIYFSPEAIRAAVNAIAHLLAPAGFLFLGPAETLRGVSDDFSLCHTHETFYYRRKSSIAELIPFSPLQMNGNPPGPAISAASVLVPQVAAPAVLPGHTFPLVSVEPQGVDWMQEIERSSDRIKGLDTERLLRLARPDSKTDTGGAASRRSRTTGEELLHATALFRAEQYDEFLKALEQISSAAAADPDLQLLRSLAHLNRRELDRAEAISRQLVARDSMNASGHYVLALCREHAGDLAGAADHDRIAIYLDPVFAMPHMHLALISRRRGDRHTARREFEQAILLLARESESRLLMFAGGFNREALRKLCRRELQAMGAA